jgi:hypothetical protein
VHRADNLATVKVPSVLKSGSLILLKHSRPVKACNGIALPLPLYIHNMLSNMYYISYYNAKMMVYNYKKCVKVGDVYVGGCEV